MGDVFRKWIVGLGWIVCASTLFPHLCGAAETCTARMKESVLRRTGGFVTREGCGVLLLVNSQKDIPASWIQAKADYLSRLLGIRAVIADQEEDADATIVVVLQKGTGTKVERERRRAVFDVSVFKNAPEAACVFNEKLSKLIAELIFPPERGTQHPRSAIEDVFVGDAFTTSAVEEVKQLLPHFGFTRGVVATYDTACREGWAPKPVNEAQREIWRRTLTRKERGPSNPIRILPPGKRK